MKIKSPSLLLEELGKPLFIPPPSFEMNTLTLEKAFCMSYIIYTSGAKTTLKCYNRGLLIRLINYSVLALYIIIWSNPPFFFSPQKQENINTPDYFKN